MDSVWVLVSAFLVFFMHAGFALVESGFGRKKNAVATLLKNVSVVAIGSIAFFLVGYGFMFGEGNAIAGFSSFAPDGAGDVGGLPTYVFLFFQLVFAATAATIVSGAVAERARLETFFVFTLIAVAIIYPIAGHWTWGGGFLSTWGFHDFAGSTVVHAVGGGMALAGAMMIGPRIGRYDSSGKPVPMPAHNLPMGALGVLVLWLGWFGFNGGSTLSADPALVAPVVLATNLAGAAGFLAALTHARLRTGVNDLSLALNGALAGLVAITAGADVISPLESLLVGLTGGVVVVEGIFLLDRLKIDDPVGAIPVHLMCGVVGTLLVGVFANSGDFVGVLHGGGFALLGVQAAGAAVSVSFAVGAGALVWGALKLLPGGIRASREHEIEGLDRADCGTSAYGEELSGGHAQEGLLELGPAEAKAASAVELESAAE